MQFRQHGRRLDNIYAAPESPFGNPGERLGDRGIDGEKRREIRQPVADEQGLAASFELKHWHPTAEEWEDPDKPLPQTDAERAAERAELMQEERDESREQGFAEFEVRVKCPHHRDAQRLARLDSALWTFSALDFLPHVYADSQLASMTPVWLSMTPAHERDVLLLLDDEAAPDFESWFGRFERVIEIVSSDEEDRARARVRFKAYRERGFEPRSFEVGSQ